MEIEVRLVVVQAVAGSSPIAHLPRTACKSMSSWRRERASLLRGMPTGVQYLALLRGINVGGKILVKMANLRAAFEGMGLYFSRLASQASSSRLSKIVTLPEYQDMTIRSWSTTRKLLALMDSR